MTVFLSEDELQRIVAAATNGTPYRAPNTYAQRIYDNVKAEVEVIRARGGYVDTSSGI